MLSTKVSGKFVLEGRDAFGHVGDCIYRPWNVCVAYRNVPRLLRSAAVTGWSFSADCEVGAGVQCLHSLCPDTDFRSECLRKLATDALQWCSLWGRLYCAGAVSNWWWLHELCEFSSEAVFELLGTFWVLEISSKADILELGRPWVKRQALRRGLGVQISIHIFRHSICLFV